MSKKRRKFQCWIGNHCPKKITETLYVKSDNEFSNSSTPMAGAVCIECGHIWLEKRYGHFSYYTSDEITREEAIELTKKRFKETQ